MTVFRWIMGVLLGLCWPAGAYRLLYVLRIDGRLRELGAPRRRRLRRSRL